MTLKISVAGKSDIGLVRTGNEDYLKIDTDQNLFLVCDGMGGHQAGEVASKEACEIISYCFTELGEELIHEPFLNIGAPLLSRGALLVEAIRLANRSIYLRSRSRSDLTGMGTTVVAVALDEGIINISHVGDSRVYRLTPSALVPLTTDHSWVSELKQSGQLTEAEAEKIIGRNVITRALGVNERVEIDYRADAIAPGEIYLLCTDGLCGYVGDDEIFDAIKDRRGDINMIVEDLVQLANERGGQDNVTVLAVRIDNVDEDAPKNIIKPVTVSIESDDALLRENQILESIISRAEQTRDVVTAEKNERKPLQLILIFAAFLIIAVIVIYLASGK